MTLTVSAYLSPAQYEPATSFTLPDTETAADLYQRYSTMRAVQRCVEGHWIEEKPKERWTCLKDYVQHVISYDTIQEGYEVRTYQYGAQQSRIAVDFAKTLADALDQVADNQRLLAWTPPKYFRELDAQDVPHSSDFWQDSYGNTEVLNSADTDGRTVSELAQPTRRYFRHEHRRLTPDEKVQDGDFCQDLNGHTTKLTPVHFGRCVSDVSTIGYVARYVDVSALETTEQERPTNMSVQPEAEPTAMSSFIEEKPGQQWRCIRGDVHAVVCYDINILKEGAYHTFVFRSGTANHRRQVRPLTTLNEALAVALQELYSLAQTSEPLGRLRKLNDDEVLQFGDIRQSMIDGSVSMFATAPWCVLPGYAYFRPSIDVAAPLTAHDRTVAAAALHAELLALEKTEAKMTETKEKQVTAGTTGTGSIAATDELPATSRAGTALSELWSGHVLTGAKIGTATHAGKRILAAAQNELKNRFGKKGRRWVRLMETRIGQQVGLVVIPGVVYVTARVFAKQIPQSSKIAAVSGYAVTGAVSELTQTILAHAKPFLETVAALADDYVHELPEPTVERAQPTMREKVAAR